jgi:hypothetical protein
VRDIEALGIAVEQLPQFLGAVVTLCVSVGRELRELDHVKVTSANRCGRRQYPSRMSFCQKTLCFVLGQ